MQNTIKCPRELFSLLLFAVGLLYRSCLAIGVLGYLVEGPGHAYGEQ